MSEEVKWVFRVQQQYGIATVIVAESEVDSLKVELNLGDEWSEGSWTGQVDGTKCYSITPKSSNNVEVDISRALFNRVAASKKCVLSMAA